MLSRGGRLLLSLGRTLCCDVQSGAPRPAPAPLDPLQQLHDALGRRHNYLRISLTERCNLRYGKQGGIGGFWITQSSEVRTAYSRNPIPHYSGSMLNRPTSSFGPLRRTTDYPPRG